MSAELERAPSERAIREAGVRLEGAPPVCCSRRCDRFPSINPRDQHLGFEHSQLKFLR